MVPRNGNSGQIGTTLPGCQKQNIQKHSNVIVYLLERQTCSIQVKRVTTDEPQVLTGVRGQFRKHKPITYIGVYICVYIYRRVYICMFGVILSYKRIKLTTPYLVSNQTPVHIVTGCPNIPNLSSTQREINIIGRQTPPTCKIGLQTFLRCKLGLHAPIIDEDMYIGMYIYI